MTTKPTTDYVSVLKKELEDIDKLVETPNIIRQIAISALKYAREQTTTHLAQRAIENSIQSLENIKDKSISENFKTIYSQMCILAVSSIEALLKRYFINVASDLSNINPDNEALRKIRISAEDLVHHKLRFTQSFGDLLLSYERSSFQDLQSIKRVFKEYFNKEISISNESEKALVYYFELRHILVHRGGKIDEKFLNSTKKMNANLYGYKKDDTVVLNAKDWERFRTALIELVSEATKMRKK